MIAKKPNYEELTQQLAEARQVITALRDGEVDAIISERDIALLRARKLETELRQSEENFRSSLADSPLGICITTNDGETTYANRSMLDIYGYDTIEELNATPIKKRYTPESYAEHQIRKEKRRRGEDVPSDYEISIVRKNGEVHHLGVFRKEVLWNGKKQFQVLYNDITERKRTEHQAKERMKELQVFYSLAEITEREGITLDKLYQELTNILPKSWQYTENACARIVIGDSEFRTKNFTESAWKQSAPVKVNRSVVGRIDVGYLEQKPEEDEGPFLKEERLLIDAIAERLGHVTERKQAEDALRDSEEKWRSLTENTNDTIVVTDNNDVIRYINRTIPPTTPEGVVGKTIYEYVSREHHDVMRESLKKVYKTGNPDSYEVTLDMSKINPKIGALWFNTKLVPIKTDKEVNGVIMIATDITERKQAEEALRESEERYRTLFESAAQGILIADTKTKKLKYANPAVCTMLGYSQEELPKMDIDDIHPNASVEHVFAEFDAQARGEKILSPAIPCLKKDGTIVYADINSAKATIDGRECNIGFFTDITERKRMQDTLAESEVHYRELAESISDVFFAFDEDLRYIYWNKASEKLTGIPAKDALGKHLYDIFPDSEQTRGAEEVYKKALKTKQPQHFVSEYQLEGKDFSFEISAYPSKSVLSVFVKDVTERRQAQQAQKRLSQQLQAKVSELEAFSFGIAHDLRSPLVSIEGFSRLLRDDMLNHDAERVQEDMRLLESGVRKMQDFLNSTLEYSRAGHLMERTKNVSFGKIVNEVITGFSGQISSIGATVSLAETFPRVCVDRMRIRQVLTNLIQNSINYRDKTVPLKIEIGYRLSKGETIFFVRDNGLGMDASETEKVFALFYRGTADGEGSGIGLAIVKKIIEAHGGRIWVKQGQSGKGTTMCFTLPKQSGTNKGDNNGKD